MIYYDGKPFGDFIDADKGLVDRVIFSDQSIYEMELERIFARAWNFMCHESQIPKAGDFFLSFIGEESVIATRDKKGQLQVLLNSCRHRGNAVCRAEEGNARSFLCTYHGWTYGLDGSLIGVPGYKDFYHEQLDKSQWGLVRAGKVASYKGFIFATMDPEAPDLDEYLGPVAKIGLDLIAEHGDMICVGGIQKNIIGCNWKLAVDNLFDWYHVGISHASAMLARADTAGGSAFGTDPFTHRVLLGEYGHGISGPRITPEMREQMAALPDDQPRPPMMDERWRDKPQTAESLGAAGRDTRGHPNVFPNLWVANGPLQLCLRLPRGPHNTELWWFTFVDGSKPAEEQAATARRVSRGFGPAGMLEQDDGENWDQSTRQTHGVIARKHPLNFSMNLGHGAPTVLEDGVPFIEAPINEHAQLWLYRNWAEWMDADSWPTLKKTHSPVPVESV